MDSELWIFNRSIYLSEFVQRVGKNRFSLLLLWIFISYRCNELYVTYTLFEFKFVRGNYKSFLTLISFWINILILVLLITNHPSKQRKFNKIFLLSRFNVQIHPLIFRMVGRSPSQVSNSRSYGMPRISTCLEDSEFAHAWEFRPPAYTQDGVSLVTAHIGILESI